MEAQFRAGGARYVLPDDDGVERVAHGRLSVALVLQAVMGAPVKCPPEGITRGKSVTRFGRRGSFYRPIAAFGRGTSGGYR